jgi:anti-sigma B factor antagonist
MPDDPLRVENIAGSLDGCQILRLTGPLTLANLFGFQNVLRAEKARATIIDLTSVPYIDSAGIGALLGAHVSRQKEGRSLALVGVNQRVKNALEITHVWQFFSVFPSVAEAQSAVPQGGAGSASRA